MIVIKTAREIGNKMLVGEINQHSKWVSVESLLQDLEEDIDKGNFKYFGTKGFKGSLWISKIKKELTK